MGSEAATESSRGAGGRDASGVDVYTDESLFQTELDRLFGTAWLFVAHESQVPDAGDYWTSSLGTQPVIVSRHEDGGIFVLFNRCRHRGSVVCRLESGHSNYFRCPYHAWGYANDGALVGVAQSSGYPDIDKSAWGLRRAERVGIYRGLVFASVSSDGPTLEEYLAPQMTDIDAWFDRGPGDGIRVLAPSQRRTTERNWKREVERLLAQTGVSSAGGDVFVFPNLWLRGTHLRVVNPEAVGSTQVITYVYALDGATPERNSARFREHERSYGPAGLCDTDQGSGEPGSVSTKVGSEAAERDLTERLQSFYKEWRRWTA